MGQANFYGPGIQETEKNYRFNIRIIQNSGKIEIKKATKKIIQTPKKAVSDLKPSIWEQNIAFESLRETTEQLILKSKMRNVKTSWLDAKFYSVYKEASLVLDQIKEVDEMISSKVESASKSVPLKNKSSTKKKPSPYTNSQLLEKSAENLARIFSDKKNVQWTHMLADTASLDFKEALALKLKDHLYEFCFLKQTSVFVMKLLSFPTDSEPRNELLKKMEDDFKKCMENPHSNNVLQHFLEQQYGNCFTRNFIC